jgi:hypothetical protein
MMKLLVLSIALSSSQAFIFNAFTAYPSLQDIAKAQTDTQLSVRLDIGKKKSNPFAPSTPHLFLDGLMLDLLQAKAPKGCVTLPGADGPHPQTSSGARTVNIHQLPYFIGMNGMEKIKLEQGAWELVWRETSPGGSLICGFEVPKAAERNGARLPAGRMYLSFPVWTYDGLMEQQEAKADAEKRANEFLQEKNDALQAMQETNNLFMKAWQYRNAAAAYEKHELTGIRWYQWIPDMDHVVKMQDDLYVGMSGSVFTMDKGFFKAKHLIGEAMIRPAAKVEADELRP